LRWNGTVANLDDSIERDNVRYSVTAVPGKLKYGSISYDDVVVRPGKAAIIRRSEAPRALSKVELPANSGFCLWSPGRVRFSVAWVKRKNR
jgi:hypothetical protein